MTSTKIQFIGASGTVTGSMFRVYSEEVNVLVDCGMYQGQDVESKNLEPFPFSPEELDAVIITHSHLDHIGLLPKLVRQGFNGVIYLTAQTAQIAEVILYDSAKLQEYDEDRLSSEKLYDTTDVAKAISLFKILPFYEVLEIKSALTLKLIPAGHILGAASAVLTCEDKCLLFSGDLGRKDQSIIESLFKNDYSSIIPNYIIMESLYGCEEHSDKNLDIEKMVEVINSVQRSGGRTIIPVFALHRAQEILEILKFLFSYGKLKSSINVYLDSPMAIDITKIYEDNSSVFNGSISMLGRSVSIVAQDDSSELDFSKFTNQNRFKFLNLKTVRKSKKSQKISNSPNALILAGSGMADGGRVVKHLMENLPDPKSAVLFVGYQAEGTLGRQLVDGAKRVMIYDQDIKVNARIEYFRGFSAHAGGNDLVDWIKKFNNTQLKQIFLVHGENERIQKFNELLGGMGYNAVAPQSGNVYEIS